MRYACLFLAPLLLILAAACGSSGQSPDASSTTNAASSTAMAVTATPATSTGDGTGQAPQDTRVGAYLALGDSLSYGNGASNREQTAFVPLVFKGLGAGEQINLGVPGHTSTDLIGAPLEQAISDIKQRRDDGIPGNGIGAITLEIGGNDLLGLYFDYVVPGICPNVQEGLANPKCVDGVRKVLDTFGPNLDSALTRLKEAAPDVPIFLLTLYNPFSGAASTSIDQLAQLALEGSSGTPFPEGLNDTIRKEAQKTGVNLVDIYPLFLGKSGQYIANDLIHPNDTGYRVMAGAVLEAMRAAGLPFAHN